MALSILDGNQSATTLSTIVTSGQHIPAHTVVSLGTQAISNITSAVSGTSVTFGLVGGTVTANNFTLTNVLQYDGSHYFLKVGGVATTGGTSFPVYIAGSVTANPTGTQAIAGTVTANVSDVVGGGYSTLVDLLANETIAVRELPAISGTVTANAGSGFPGVIYSGILQYIDDEGFIPVGQVGALPSGTNRIGVVTIGGGTVTIGAGTAQIGSVNIKDANGNTWGADNYFPVVINSGNVNLVSSIPAGTNQIGSVTASISGTVPISISSVTVGNSVTIGSLPAISGTVTANTFALQGTTVTTSNFTSTTASTVLASYNATRQVLTIFNEGAGNLHICAGETCTTIAYQVRLSAGDYYEVPNHQTTITHSAVFATAGTARICQVVS